MLSLTRRLTLWINDISQNHFVEQQLIFIEGLMSVITWIMKCRVNCGRKENVLQYTPQRNANKPVPKSPKIRFSRISWFMPVNYLLKPNICGFWSMKTFIQPSSVFFSSIPDINALIALFNNVWTRNGGTKYSTPTRIPWNRIELLLFNLLFLFACVQVNVFSLLYQVPQFDDYSS